MGIGNRPARVHIAGLVGLPSLPPSPIPHPPSPRRRSSVATPITVGILLSRVRIEEKLLLAEMERRGARVERFDDRELTIELGRPTIACDVVLERCINHLRALYALRVLGDWGIPTVNTFDVANTCGDKLLTSAALVRDGIPTPRTIL